MIRLRLIVLIICGALLSNACSAELPIKLNLSSCHVPPNGIPASLVTLIGPHAKHYVPYLVLCPVKDQSDSTVLQILALRADKAAAQHQLYFLHGKPWNESNGADLNDTDPLPRPIILTMTDKVIGHLPELLFRDGPGSTSVSFTDWHSGLPHRIFVRVDGAAVLGTYCPPPLIWSAAHGRYIEKPGPRFQACHD